MGTALAAETRQAVRNNNQVSAICNSLAATLGGARLPSAPTVLLYRFETVEDATLFRDKARITGARLDIQARTTGRITWCQSSDCNNAGVAKIKK